MQYEIRAMSFAEILDTALRLVTNHFVLLVGLFALINIPAGLLTTYLSPDAPNVGEQVSAAEAVGMVNSALVMVLVVGTVFALLYPIGLAATTFAISEQYCGRTVSMGEAIRYAVKHLGKVSGTWMLSTLAIAVAFLFLIIPGIYVALWLSAVWPVMVVERVYGLKALRRSHDLMDGNLMRAIGIFIVAGLIGTVLGGGAQLVLGKLPVVGAIAGPIVQSITGAYTAAAEIVFYFDIRCRKEGFDIEHLAALVEQQGVEGVAGA